MNVVEFRRREPRDPHLAGEALCLACGHRWTGVAPIGVHQLECPQCHTLRGAWTLPPGESPDTKVFTCAVARCGSQNMRITLRAGAWEIHCMRCAAEHSLDVVFGAPDGA